jgi:hypothetical protein
MQGILTKPGPLLFRKFGINTRHETLDTTGFYGIGIYFLQLLAIQKRSHGQQ